MQTLEQLARYTETTDSQMPAFMKSDPKGEYVRFDQVKKLLESLNTRPDAPVEGLVTERWDYLDGSIWKMCKDLPGQYIDKGFQVRELVTRSQAEAIIAAKDYLLSVSDTVAQQLQNQIVTLTLKKEDLEAHNAALTARVARDDAAFQELIKLGREADTKFEALETQLAAAKEAHKSLFGDKTMEGILWPDVKPTDLITIRVQKQIYDKARAALEASHGE